MTRAIDRNRRGFLRACGLVVVTVTALSLEAEASGAVDGAGGGGDLRIHSGPGLFRHVHELLIPRAVLVTPPAQGISLVTTEAMWHRHTIALSSDQLRTVAQGGTVTQKASSHIFLIAVASGQA